VGLFDVNNAAYTKGDDASEAPAIPSRLGGLLGLVAQPAPPPAPPAAPGPAASPAGPVAPAVSLPPAGASPTPAPSAARPAGPVPPGLGIQRGAPVGGLAGLIAQLAPTNDGFLEKLEKEHTSYTDALGRLRGERQGLLKQRDAARVKMDPLMAKYFETKLDKLDQLEESYPYKQPTPPKYQELPPPPPGTQLRPFGDPGEHPTAMQAISGALDQLTLIASMGTALGKKNAAGAVAALGGAMSGWRAGDRERAENAWLAYRSQIEGIREHNQNLSKSYADEVRAHAFDLETWESRAHLWANKHEVAGQWLDYINKRDVGRLEDSIAENDKATHTLMENLKESDRLLIRVSTDRRQSLKNFVDAIQKERGLDIRERGVTVREKRAADSGDQVTTTEKRVPLKPEDRKNLQTELSQLATRLPNDKSSTVSVKGKTYPKAMYLEELYAQAHPGQRIQVVWKKDHFEVEDKWETSETTRTKGGRRGAAPAEPESDED